MSEKENDTSEKRKPLNRKIIIIPMIILIILIFTVGSGYLYVREKIYTNSESVEVDNTNTISEDSDELKKSDDEEEYTEVDGITNVLLIGADGLEGEETPKSDSIIIATLDNNNDKVKLTSLYRDTLVNIPGYGQNRINISYELGGTKLLMETIKETYNININKYVIIDFRGFEAVIDKIGGMEINIKDYQLKELNKYIGESTGGNDCPVTEVGTQLLNGKQTLSYARIRKNVGDDFERTERQREVVFKLAEELKETKPTKYLGIMNTMLDYVKTNIEPMQALNLAYTIYKFPSLKTEQLSIPMEGLCVDKSIPGIGDVLVMDKYVNSEILHDFIFNNKSPES